MTRRTLPPLTGTPLDYPIHAPVDVATIPDTPDRPSRLWGYVYVCAAFIVGVIAGAAVGAHY